MLSESRHLRRTLRAVARWARQWPLGARAVETARWLHEANRRGDLRPRARARARRQAAERIHQDLESLPSRPLISLVMPTYRTDLRYLREGVESVRRQHYPEWELIVVDDGSEEPALTREVQALAAADPRIRFEPLAENLGIAAATNAGLSLCAGEFVGFLDHDDTLTEDALLRVAQTLAADPELDVVYSDQDKLDLHGHHADPFLKPAWSPVYALGAMYVGHLLVVRRSVVEAVGGFDPAFDKIQDFEFMLRVSERTQRIGHIPEILYHWRAIPGSIAAGTEEKSGVPELQARAVSAHLERLGSPARAVPHPQIPHRSVLIPRNGHEPQEVSVVVVALGGRSPQPLLDSISERTDDGGIEVLVEDGRSRSAASNAGAARASGDLLIFLDSDCEVVEADWVAQLALHLRLPGVGAVGPMLVRPDGRVDEAGLAIGLSEPTLPIMRGFEADGDGYYGSLPCAREVSALSALCLAVPKGVFEQVGGFDENYRSQYEGADFCRRLARNGLSAVFAPRPRVVTRQTSAVRRAQTDIVDRALFVDCWYEDLMRGDSYFNRGFSARAANYAPAGWRDRLLDAARGGG
jgi:GT2 family glycosyltransferase